MPSLVVTKNLSLPNDVLGKLDDLDNELSEGDLTEKGYCKRKWMLLKPYVQSSLCDRVSVLQKKLESAALSENDYFKEMKELLDLNAITKFDQSNENVSDPVIAESEPNKSEDLKDDNKGEVESSVAEPESIGKTPNKRSSRTKKQQQSLSDMFSALKKNVESSKNGESSNKNIVDIKSEVEEEACEIDDVKEIPEKKRKLDTEVKEELNENKSVEEAVENNDSNKENHVAVDVDYDSDNVVPKKRTKQDNYHTSRKQKPKSPGAKDSIVVPEKCKTCHQLLEDNDTIMYSGHPTGAVEEYVALTDPRLMLFNGTESDINEHDERPQNKITYFSVYDKEGHLCPFDTGLVERNVLLYFSGYIKAVYEECADVEGGIPAFDIGPINEWWISGFDGGEKALIGFSTPYGEYYLMQPSKAYEPIMEAVTEKIYMGKLVIEFLLDEINPTYEDLLNKLQTTVPPKGLSALTEDSLLRHAQFICDQVQSFDAAADSPDNQLITSPCMRALVKLAGVTFGKRRAMRRTEKKELKEKKTQWSKATSTPLVSDVFETFFNEQLDKTENGKEDLHGPRRRRCGICEACQQPDCGTCAACLDMIKFGGSGRAKQACSRRRCPNMAIQEADDSDNEEENEIPGLIDETSSQSWTSRPRGICTRTEKKNISWVGDPVKEDTRKTYFSKVMVGNEELSPGGYVLVEPSDSGVPMFIGHVIYMWHDNLTKEKYFHAQWFCRGSDTVLGETSDENEIFLLYECEDLPMTAVKSTVKVKYLASSPDCALEGGKALEEVVSPESEGDGKSFFYQKRYDPEHGRFEDLEEDLPCRRKEMEHRFCPACERIYLRHKNETPSVNEKLENTAEEKEVHYGVVYWRGEEYRVGSFVFLAPDIFKFRRQLVLTNGGSFSLKKENSKDEKVDEDVYPEYYRKTSDHVKGSNLSTPPPFCIGYISAILTRSHDKLVASQDICLKVNKMYRPENTHKGPSLFQQANLNMIYWSDEQKIVNFGDVAGKCYAIFSENIETSVDEWTSGGPNRFYFTQAYDSSKQAFVDPPSMATHIGSIGKGKGKGKGKSKSKQEEKKDNRAKPWPNILKPLRCLDVFAGCGGLSLGLHQSGIAESHWAIEKEEAAAHAFRLNNPNATVFTEDCNLLLKMVMNGEKKNDKGQVLPQKGEVELLCGGPPCQGFSGMNRFNSRQYSLFKNSLVVSYLAYCDYYRPRFFILENVRNFVSFKRSMVLKLALRCLVRMGYQCTFGVLQAGNYGVPQTRRRAIIIAAAPGEKLPLFPEPTHTFNPRTTQLTVMVDEKKFVSNCRWIDCAPRRTITVRDAMSDLPEIRNGARCDEMPYNGDPVSHFQRLIRGDQYQPMLTDHICKEMAPLVEARIAQIPTRTGSDWRDLPNIAIRLPDGTYTKKLQYTHHDKKNGKSSTGALRGVCSCASGKPCDPMDRQFNTLIPWCLPHTGNRHNHWAGLYGRLEWDGFFSTTVTNPEPMGKQGRVLHPEQTRVVSVRECARSQGFPDTYRFFGTILDKHRQIGNAVPPPMGEAVGYEIRKCVSENELKLKMDTKPIQIEAEKIN